MGNTAGRRRHRRAAGRATAHASGPALRQVTSVHTLGPEGTNCASAARRWFEGQGRCGEVVLYRTFEDAARGALAIAGGALLAPAAYPDLNTLIYSHLDRLYVADSMVMATHRMVLARRPGTGRPVTVASHPAPVALLEDRMVATLVSSNAQAAIDCAVGLADGCITTDAAMELHGLELVRDFGPVAMAFSVHVRTADRAGLPARPGVTVGRYDDGGISHA